MKPRSVIGGVVLLILVSQPFASAEMSIDSYKKNLLRGGSAGLAAKYYLTGILDGLEWANAALESDSRLFCARDKLVLTDDQATDILDRFIVSHSSTLPSDIRVALALLSALEEAFPCPKN